MALIKIKQINNSPANTGGIIVYDGSNNVWSNNDDGAVQLSSGATGDRPTGVDGMIRYNTTLDCVEAFIDGTWRCLKSKGQPLGAFFQHAFTGGQKDAWMFYEDSNSSPPSGPESSGDVAPAVMPFACVVSSLTFTNKNDNVSVDVELYKNGSLFYTWSVTNSHVAYKTTSLTAVTFSAGDRLGIYLDDVGTGNDADQASVVVNFEVTSNSLIDGSTQTL